MAATRTLTEFLQHSGRILPEIEQGEVVLRRRDGDEIVLMSRQHWQALESSLRVLAEAYDAGRTGEWEHAAPREWFSLPWLALLHDEDRRACLDELITTALAALGSGRLAALAETLDRWRATALATWDDDRAREEGRHVADEPLPLPRP